MTSSTTKTFNFDFGTKPTTDIYDTIVVKLDSDVMLHDFSDAYYWEMQRRNPMKFDSMVNSGRLSIELLDYYFQGILMIRIQSVQGHCPVWRQAKGLYIPTWIQFCISMLGEYKDINYGLKIVPTFNFDYEIDHLLEISQVIHAFEIDGLTMHRDAFPRSPEGDKDLMSMALINGYVKSLTDTATPIFSYVSAFLGAKLEEEATFKILYRVRYDDVRFIRDMLIREEAIF